MKGYSKKGIILLCCLVYFTSYFARKDFAAVTVGMLSAEALTKEIAGLIGTALFAMYGIGQIISGYLGDRVSPKTLILVGLGTTALCNLAMPLISTPVLMIPVWAVNGLAQAMLWPPIVRILSKYLDHDTYVKANLLVTAAAHVATILLYLYVPVCLELMDWRYVFFSATALCAIIFVVFAIGLGICLPKNAEAPSIAPVTVENKKKDLTEQAIEGSFAALLARAGIIPIFGSIIAIGFLRDGIESWLPTLYSEAFNRDASESTLVSVALPIFAIGAIILITSLHKKLLRNEAFGASVMFGVAAFLCIPLFLLINTTSSVLRIICLVLAALVCGAMHGGNFLLISCLPGRFARYGRAAGASGFCNAFVYVGAAVSTYGLAIISDRFGWSGAIIAWFTVAALGILCTVLAMKRYTAFYKDCEKNG